MNIIESTPQFPLLSDHGIKDMRRSVNNENGSVGICSDSIFIKTQDYFRKVAFSDILYIEASGSYCNFYLQTGPKMTVAYTLAETAQHLPKDLFIRVHRSFVINVKHVNGFVGNIFYVGEQMIPIGRLYKKEALSHFNVLGTIS